jgi:hypothetical protein
LTIVPPRGNKREAPVANIGFVVYHRGLPVNDFRYLGTEETMSLDWTDPWYSKFDNRNLRRQYSAPMNVFLYVEPYEVRCEIIARPYDLEQWIDLGLEAETTIRADVQGGLKQRVAEFLVDHINVTIDGEPVTPILDRIHFLRRTLKTSIVIDPPEDLDIVSATLGVIYSFPTDGLPQEATLTWDLFGPRIQNVPAAATDEAGPLPYRLIPDDNVLRWQNFLKNPTLPTLVDIESPPHPILRALPMMGWIAVLGLAALVVRHGRPALRGIAPPARALGFAGLFLVLAAGSFVGSRTQGVNQARSERLLTGLLHNVYRAFDYRGEETIYDALEQSVTGDLLTQTYLETRRGLELANQGGARAKVKDIEMLAVEPRSLGRQTGFAARCRWNVSGSVGHWGHVHQRTNRYEADLTVKPVDGVWKITALELLEEERL